MARVELNLTLFHTRHKVTAAGEGWRESSARLDIMTCGPNLWLGPHSQTEPMRGLCDHNMTNQRAEMISFSASQRARGSSMHSARPAFSVTGQGRSWTGHAVAGSCFWSFNIPDESPHRLWQRVVLSRAVSMSKSILIKRSKSIHIQIIFVLYQLANYLYCHYIGPDHSILILEYLS